MSKEKNKSVLFSTVITLVIVAMLIISGPAQAVSVIITGLQDTPYTKGSSVNFTVSINISGQDKYVPVTNISLDVNGPATLKSTFFPNGTLISGNPNIHITPTSIPKRDQYGYGYGYGFDNRTGDGYDFGYGYGYGYGYGSGKGGAVIYIYNVSINTTDLPAGDYETVATLNSVGTANEHAFRSSPAAFTIIPVTTPPMEVKIEISPKKINPGSHGEITVTVFSNDSKGFDVDNVNISTVRFGPDGAKVVKNNTAAKKLILKFNTEDTGIQCGDTSATLTGKTYDGKDITGTDTFETTGCKKISLSLDPVTHRTTTTVTEKSPGGDVTVIVPEGTLALDKNGNPLSYITVDSLTELPEKAAKKLSQKHKPHGEFVKLRPAGATFEPPIQIRYDYKEPLPDGVSENDLQIWSHNSTTDSWETLTVFERNPAGNYIIANVSHFSTFALIGIASEGGGGGGGGSGGGGGGVISQEPFDNILKAETHEKYLIANSPVTYTFNTPELGVYEITVTGKENENDVSIRVEALKGTSKLITSAAPGTVFKNVNVWAGTKKIKEALIRLKVENTWLESNNFAAGELKMVKWVKNEWTLLDTTEIKKDETFTYFEAKTDTFSIFAITGLKGGVLPTPTPVVSETPPEEGTPTPTGTPSEEGEAPPVNLAIIIGVFVVIALAVVVYIKRKEIFKK